MQADFLVNADNIEHIYTSTTAISKWSINLLSSIGVPDGMIKYLNMVFLLALLVVVVLLMQYVTKIVFQAVLDKIQKVTHVKFLEHLSKRKFAYYLAMIVPFSIVKGSIPIVFDGFPKLITLGNKATDIYLVFYIIWIIMAVINASADSLRLKPSLRDKPLDSYVQVVKIIFNVIGFIIIFSILTGNNPGAILTGLGAASAILMLVFKDTILGLVASMQVSANDMVRIGDWITMPKYGADGDVIQITLTTVKVRNFDKTIITLPPYALVSDSFQNWRGMTEMGGRRLKRSIKIKQGTIKFVSQDELDRYRSIELISDYVNERSKEIDDYNEKNGVDKAMLLNGRNLTNLGLFRQYIYNYLKANPNVHKEMTIMVRQLEPSGQGMPLELYFFTNTTVWGDYENIVSDVFDHVAASAKYFDLEIFEDLSND
ncbi:MAG: mechanosensitive ion channel family protein [Fermentimonas sp.]|jgi:miniconductance mechanosensitive channel